jgi:hypothetical protein
MRNADELTVPAVQRLEAWMKEVTDLLCYQPEIPVAHKSCLIDAFVAFQNEITPIQRKGENELRD